MKHTTRTLGVFAMMLMTLAGFTCSRPEEAPKDLPKPKMKLPAPSHDEAHQMRTAVFAGGCFWCTEAVFEQLKGVKSVVSGFAGGKKSTADYQTVSAGVTNHAESIQITYDPSVINYGDLLQVFFGPAHDPTELNRQGPDRGRQYRSAIFYANEQEKHVAEAYINQLETAKVYDKPIVTTLEPLTGFYPAVPHHQDYVAKHPNDPYVRVNSMPKIAAVRKDFPNEVKSK